MAIRRWSCCSDCGRWSRRRECVPLSRLRVRGCSLIQPPSIRDGFVGCDHYDLARAVGEAEHKHLRHELADLLRREVDDGSNLAANEAGRIVVSDDLRRGPTQANPRAEIDAQLQRRTPRLRKGLDADD